MAMTTTSSTMVKPRDALLSLAILVPRFPDALEDPRLAQLNLPTRAQFIGLPPHAQLQVEVAHAPRQGREIAPEDLDPIEQQLEGPVAACAGPNGQAPLAGRPGAKILGRIQGSAGAPALGYLQPAVLVAEDGQHLAPSDQADTGPRGAHLVQVEGDLETLEALAWRGPLEGGDAPGLVGLDAAKADLPIDQGYGDAEALITDYARCAELAFDAGAHLIELNLSCPNVHGACASVYLDPESAEAVSRAVRGAVGKQKVLVKLGYYEERPRLEMVLRAVLPHVDGIAAINTVSRPVRSPDGKVALPGRERSGICGAAIRSAALGTVEQLCSLREKLLAEFAVVGVGGIMTPADAMAHLRVGADAVMMATAPMYDPYLAMRLREAGDWPARR